MMKQSFSEDSWSGESHISPKNTKWLADNLEEVDKLVQEMLKLIEEDGDSFAQKAAMYYQRRPKLLALVEDFYRMYRSLAERFDNVTGELCRTAQHSGDSDSGSISSWQSIYVTPAVMLAKHRPKNRAAGFDVLHGSGWSSGISRKGTDMSSLNSDQESESGSSEAENGHTEIIEHDDGDGSNTCEQNGIKDDAFQVGIAEMEKELSGVRVRLCVSEVEIARLNQELESKSMDFQSKISELEQKLALADDKRRASEDLNQLLGNELEDSISIRHKREEELVLLKQQIQMLADRHHAANAEVNDLMAAHAAHVQFLNLEFVRVCDDHLAVKQLLETRIEELNASMRALLQEKTICEDVISGQQCKIKELEASLLSSAEDFSKAKSQLMMEITELHQHLDSSMRQVEELNKHMDHLKLEKDMITCEKDELAAKLKSQEVQLHQHFDSSRRQVEELNKHMDRLKLEKDAMTCERDELDMKLKSQGDQMFMEGELLKLNAELERLVGESREIKGRVRELEEEVERQRLTIWEGAENKREAIRQLCSSLDYYRVGYMELRHVLFARNKPRMVF